MNISKLFAFFLALDDTFRIRWVTVLLPGFRLTPFCRHFYLINELLHRFVETNIDDVARHLEELD